MWFYNEANQIYGKVSLQHSELKSPLGLGVVFVYSTLQGSYNKILGSRLWLFVAEGFTGMDWFDSAFAVLAALYIFLSGSLNTKPI